MIFRLHARAARIVLLVLASLGASSALVLAQNPPRAEARAVAPRGPLAAHEQSLVNLF